jgi:hypothetical protein
MHRQFTKPLFVVFVVVIVLFLLILKCLLLIKLLYTVPVFMPMFTICLLSFIFHQKPLLTLHPNSIDAQGWNSREGGNSRILPKFLGVYFLFFKIARWSFILDVIAFLFTNVLKICLRGVLCYTTYLLCTNMLNRNYAWIWTHDLSVRSPRLTKAQVW